MSALPTVGDGAGMPPARAGEGSVAEAPAPGPASLSEACALVEDPVNQGLPLTGRDYLYLFLVTVALPALLVLIGVLA